MTEETSGENRHQLLSPYNSEPGDYDFPVVDCFEYA